MLVYPVKSHFLDSGAFSLWRGAKGSTIDYRGYMDRYATFVKANKAAIDHYANVDVIFDPEKTWAHQQYLEQEHGLRPIPLVHYGTPLKWVQHYIERGYPYIGIGGVANANMTLEGPWLQECFDLICSTPDRRPVVKTHGFGVGGHRLMARYPWYSVDTVRWIHLGSRGYFLVPKMKAGRFVFDQDPTTIKVGNDPQTFKDHLHSLPPGELAVIRAWQRELGIDDLTKPVAWYAAYLGFYERFRLTLPRFPWPLRRRESSLFGPAETSFPESLQRPRSRLKIYYSGNNYKTAEPETLLKDRARIMLTFYGMPSRRFGRVLAARQTGKPVPLDDKETVNAE